MDKPSASPAARAQWIDHLLKKYPEPGGGIHIQKHDAHSLVSDLRIYYDQIKSQSCEGKRWKELCASMLIHVEPGTGRRRAESYESEYNALVSEGLPQDDGEGQAAALSEIDR